MEYNVEDYSDKLTNNLDHELLSSLHFERENQSHYNGRNRINLTLSEVSSKKNQHLHSSFAMS